jgi:hypothetical protein
LADFYIHVQGVWLGDSQNHRHPVLTEHNTMLPLQDLTKCHHTSLIQ